MGRSTAILIARRRREESAREAKRRPEAGAAAPLHGPAEFPEGYRAVHAGGGYYHVHGPDGSMVEGLSNGKWQGLDGAAQGAWADVKGTG